MANTKLNKEQALAAHHYMGPMLVLAGPGSGKTALLCEHIRILIEEYDVDPSSILTLTFSKKAALGLRSRFMNSTDQHTYPVTFGTFHSVFYRILKQYKRFEDDCLITNEQKLWLIKDTAISMNITEIIDNKWCIDTLNAISAYKNTGKMPLYLSDEERESFPDLADRYTRRMRSSGLIDFDDMLILFLELIKKNEGILYDIRARFKYFLVDEFQDCNSIQYEIIKLLAGNEANLFCVGDDDQSIYGFRGANSRIVLDFVADYENCKVVHLLRNYRCASDIIDVAESLITHNKIRSIKPKQLASPSRGKGYVSLINSRDAYEEADKVICLIKELTKEQGYALKDIAILYRSEQSASYMKEALNKEQIAVSDVRSAEKIGKVEKIILSYLRIVTGSHEPADYYTVLNHPYRGLVRECVGNNPDMAGIIAYYGDDEILSHQATEMKNDLDMISKLDAYGALFYIWKKIGLCMECDSNEFDMLINRASGGISIEEFLKKSRTGKALDNHKQNDSVTLQTIHASKGLEYPLVFIIGLQDGIIPSKKAQKTDELEEERRLLYVAITRAIDRLYLFSRNDPDKGKQPSPFLREINL